MQEQKIKIRWLNQADYNELTHWWNWWRFPAPPREALPENGLGGMMIMKGEESICAGFLYFTNSKLAWLEFIVSNPNYREKDRAEAIVILISELSNLAKEKGCVSVFTSLRNQNLIKHFEEAGFLKGSSNTTEMILNL